MAWKSLQLSDEKMAEQVEMAARWKAGDKTVFQFFLKAYTPLIRSTARNYRGVAPHLSFDELEQVGAIGLMKGLDRNDPDKGGLPAWLKIWVRAELQQYAYSNRSSHFSLPNSRPEKKVQRWGAREVQKAEQNGHKGDAAVLEAAKALAVSPEQLRSALEMQAVSFLSLNDWTRDSRAFDYGEDDIQGGQSVSSEQQQTQANAASVLEGLCEAAGVSGRALHIIVSRNSEEFESLESVAARLNLSRERVRRIELDSLAKIKKVVDARGLTFQDLW